MILLCYSTDLLVNPKNPQRTRRLVCFSSVHERANPAPGGWVGSSQRSHACRNPEAGFLDRSVLHSLDFRVDLESVENNVGSDHPGSVRHGLEDVHLAPTDAFEAFHVFGRHGMRIVASL
jgi:hypothetical protein